MKGNTPRTGSNRTATRLAPERCAAMVAATEEFEPSSGGDATAIALARIEYAEEAEPPTTMPPPATLGQLAKNAVKTARGRQPTALLDKLGERLAFERTGARLYEGLLSKHEALGAFPGGPTQADLQHIRDEERAHFLMLSELIESQGGDPTAVTPSANVQATASTGLCAVIGDPRTNLVEGLETILVAELADNDCWDSLVELAEGVGETDLAARFNEAREHEREHLAHVREWLAAAQERSLAERAPAAADASRTPGGSRRDPSERQTAGRAAGKRQRKTVGARRTGPRARQKRARGRGRGR